MINKICFLTFLILINSCVFIDIESAGVFKAPAKYHSPKNNASKETIIEMQDGTKIIFSYLGGHCGGGVSFFGVILPVIPSYSSNTCEKEGLFISNKSSLEKNSITTIQLKYNNRIHKYYIDRGQLKFKIPNFSAFKKARDKTLIITKKTDNGNIITKEIPFEWKITTNIVVIP